VNFKLHNGAFVSYRLAHQSAEKPPFAKTIALHNQQKQPFFHGSINLSAQDDKRAKISTEMKDESSSSNNKSSYVEPIKHMTFFPLFSVNIDYLLKQVSVT
jgi:hypothetical protein